MGDIIQFKKPEKKDVQVEFLESLSPEQVDMYGEVVMLIQEEFDQLQGELIKCKAENEVLKLKIQTLEEEQWIIMTKRNTNTMWMGN